MASNLDFSTGNEPRLSVRVRGWSDENKRNFASQAQQLHGVTGVTSAGGSTSYYVNFDPNLTTEETLSTQLSDVAQSILASGDVEVAANDRPEERHVSTAVRSSTWTGIESVQERIAAFKQLAPIALAAVDCLIDQLEAPEGNGGPPLDERQEAIDALKALHEALGELLAAVDNPGFAWVDGEGLVASGAHFALRAAELLKDDPMRFAVSGLVLALCSVFGFPGLGGWLAAATLELQKKHK